MDELTRTNLIANNNEISPTFQCSFCLDLVMDPIECENCSKLFCKDCINEWLKKSTQCPNKHLFKKATDLDDWIKKDLNKIYIKCPYSKCNSQYNYNNWKNHLKVCNYKSNGLQKFTPTGDEVFKWKEVHFFVKDIHNRSHIFILPLSTTVKELKEKLKDKTGISVEEMYLLCGTKTMLNEKMLEFYNVDNYTNITQLTRLKGGC